jgi:hypothetical protein
LKQSNNEAAKHELLELEPGRSRCFSWACFYDNRKFMKKSINDNRKKRRGRPATGTAPLVGVRMTKELQDQIRDWAEEHDDVPLATAIRRLVEVGLKAKPTKG